MVTLPNNLFLQLHCLVSTALGVKLMASSAEKVVHPWLDQPDQVWRLCYLPYLHLSAKEALFLACCSTVDQEFFVGKVLCLVFSLL